MFSFLVATAFLATANALAIPLGHPYPHGRLTGGTLDNIDNYYYLATIQYANRPVCSGIAISEYYIVTAAHCVDTTKPIGTLTVRKDSQQRYVGGNVYRAESLLVHEDYRVDANGIPLNDIALIKLQQGISTTTMTRGDKLFDASEETPVGVLADVSGWSTDESAHSAPVHFSVAKTVTLGKDVCDEAYKGHGGLPAGQICAAYHGAAGSDACQGDSGAPLVVKGRVAGILSWGNGCMKAHFPAVYTEIAHYRDWIDEHAYLAPLNNLTR